MSYTAFSFFIFTAITITLYFLPPFRRHQKIILLAASYIFYAYADISCLGFILATTLLTYLGALSIDAIQMSGKFRLKYADAIRDTMELPDAHKRKGQKDPDKGPASPSDKGISSVPNKDSLSTSKAGEKKTASIQDAKDKVKNSTERVSKAILHLTLLSIFGILFFVKYVPFLLDTLRKLIAALTLEIPLEPLSILLPLGISFYTFQAAGYLIDVSRGKYHAEPGFLRLALFLSYFPQIVQGPISFYDKLSPQLYETHSFSFHRFKYGMELILWGYFKKSVIGDRIASVIPTVIGRYEEMSGAACLTALLIYAIQLYADFSAGIDISRGISEILGIDLPENFRRPYFSRNISEYWRRWHITLGEWMKNYIFYPIALSKKAVALRKKVKNSAFGKKSFGKHFSKMLPNMLATLVVFLLVGIWHGAASRYVFFGIYNGVLISVSMLLAPSFLALRNKLHISEKSIPFILFQIIRTWIFILIGYVFDIALSVTMGFRFMWKIFTNFDLNLFLEKEFRKVFGKGVSGSQALLNYRILFISLLVLLIVGIIQEKSGRRIRDILDRKPFILQFAVLFVGILFTLIYGAYGSGYDVKGFVYMNF
ncbi:MAG: MBOAT family protein [Lachnospiraceae bacterium]|nr:MBOAT family protein [Lachnospiraceae bacterium]